jgi:hypothetical protein
MGSLSQFLNIFSEKIYQIRHSKLQFFLAPLSITINTDLRVVLDPKLLTILPVLSDRI